MRFLPQFLRPFADMEAAKLYKYLPAGITWLIERLPPELQGRINEIRLRRNGVLSVSLPERNLVIQCDKGAYICTDRDMDEAVAYISRSSMYAFDSAVRNGYIPLPDGGRAGICGDAVCENGAVRSFGSINSICLRVPRLVRSYASELASYFASHGPVGALVFAPPGAGKTTYLKSVVSLLSESLRVAVADERYELSAASRGMADICTGCPKAAAIGLMTRTMSPQVIVCDEISPTEAPAVLAAQNSGCVLVASCHGRDINQVMRRDFVNRMIEKGVFSVAVRLYNDGGYRSELTEL